MGSTVSRPRGIDILLAAPPAAPRRPPAPHHPPTRRPDSRRDHKQYEKHFPSNNFHEPKISKAPHSSEPAVDEHYIIITFIQN